MPHSSRSSCSPPNCGSCFSCWPGNGSSTAGGRVTAQVKRRDSKWPVISCIHRTWSDQVPLTLSCRLAGAYAETLLSAGCRFTTQDAPSTRYSRASSASAAASMPAAVSRDKGCDGRREQRWRVHLITMARQSVPPLRAAAAHLSAMPWIRCPIAWMAAWGGWRCLGMQPGAPGPFLGAAACPAVSIPGLGRHHARSGVL